VSGPNSVQYFRASGYTLLSITAGHAAAVADLPPFHRDPFHRLLVAQALYEPLRLVTHDKDLCGYSDAIVVV
jgi:PIN domain nuclease of toxin-antitoxin system